MHLLRAISELKAPNLVSLHGCPRLLSGPPLRNIENPMSLQVLLDIVRHPLYLLRKSFFA